MGSPNGSLPDLEGTGYRASTMEERINEMVVQVAKLPLLIQSVSRFENCVQTLSQTVASYDAKITNIEQIVSSLAARCYHKDFFFANNTTKGSQSGSITFGQNPRCQLTKSLCHPKSTSFESRRIRLLIFLL